MSDDWINKIIGSKRAKQEASESQSVVMAEQAAIYSASADRFWADTIKDLAAMLKIYNQGVPDGFKVQFDTKGPGSFIVQTNTMPHSTLNLEFTRQAHAIDRRQQIKHSGASASEPKEDRFSIEVGADKQLHITKVSSGTMITGTISEILLKPFLDAL